jgi:hypothetical protein
LLFFLVVVSCLAVCFCCSQCLCGPWRTPLEQILFVGMLAVYLFRVYLIDGWYIITYGLGIYLLNNFIGFLSPQVCAPATLLSDTRHLLTDTTVLSPIVPVKRADKWRS